MEPVKSTIKAIEWQGDIRSRIELISRIIGITSSTEVDIIEMIYSVKDGQPVALSLENRLYLCVSKKMKLNTFNIAFGRLTKRGVIQKVGYAYALNPIFTDIGTTKEFRIIWK